MSNSKSGTLGGCGGGCGGGGGGGASPVIRNGRAGAFGANLALKKPGAFATAGRARVVQQPRRKFIMRRTNFR